MRISDLAAVSLGVTVNSILLWQKGLGEIGCYKIVMAKKSSLLIFRSLKSYDVGGEPRFGIFNRIFNEVFCSVVLFNFTTFIMKLKIDRSFRFFMSYSNVFTVLIYHFRSCPTLLRSLLKQRSTQNER